MRSSIEINGKKLREIRERKLVLSQREFGDKIDMSEGGLRALESGRRNKVSPRIFRAIAEVTGMSLDQAKLELGRPEQKLEEFDSNVEPYGERKVLPIPLFEMTLAAGHWVDVTGAPKVDDPDVIRQGLFRVRLRGDCMMPDYKDGQVVEFRLLQHDEPVILGRDYYLQRSDGTATFKRVESATPTEYVLRPLNRKKYPKSFTVEAELVVRVALAVAKIEFV